MAKQKKWIKARHKFIKLVLYYPFRLAARIIYGFKTEVHPDGKKRQYMIIMNHQTPFDQFFVGLTFKAPIYYVASEDLFSNGFISRLLEFAVAPIPIKKSTSDLSAIRNMANVAKEGGTISIFPEGNRTYSGSTVDIKPAITKLIKMIGLPIAIMRLEGGFGTEPRWSNIKRKCKNGVRAYVYKVLEPEEYKAMSNEEFYKVISEGLFVDDTKLGLTYKSEKRAEHIERLLYYCPNCGLSTFKSKDEKFWCTKCNRTWTYNEDLTISDLGKDDSKNKTSFTATTDWYNAQNKFISLLNSTDFADKEIYNEKVRLSQVRVYRSKKLISKSARFILMGNKYIFKSDDSENAKIFFEMNFDDIKSVSVLGRNKLNIYFKEDVYQVKSEKSFNALKYMNFYFHYINQKNNSTLNNSKGEENEFLGL